MRNLRRVLWILVAVALPVALTVMLGYGLTRDPSRIPSATVDALAPKFDLETLDGGGRLRLADYQGGVAVVNFWASWCVTCRVEHGDLVALGKQAEGREDLKVVGINYRDSRNAADAFLSRYGAYPYPSGFDPMGRTGIDFGVYGLPETYFVDGMGVIRHRHIGALTYGEAERILSRLGVEHLEEEP